MFLLGLSRTCRELTWYVNPPCTSAVSSYTSLFNNNDIIPFIDPSTERHSERIVGEEQLSTYVRRYIADFVQQRMLGIPSFALTKTIIQWLSLIGLNFEKVAKESGNTLDDFCKKVRWIRRWVFSVLGQMAFYNLNFVLLKF